MTKFIRQTEIIFPTHAEVVSYLSMLGLVRRDRLSMDGITIGDNGERIVNIARKSGEASYTLYEYEAA